jgi:hypothetical protein
MADCGRWRVEGGINGITRGQDENGCHRDGTHPSPALRRYEESKTGFECNREVHSNPCDQPLTIMRESMSTVSLHTQRPTWFSPARPATPMV